MTGFIRAAFVLAFIVLAVPYAQAADDKMLDVIKIKSPGGIEAWLVEDRSLPVVALKFAFKGAGAALDPPDKQGLSLMASNTMDEGAGDLDSQSFQKTLDDKSITLRFGSSRDHFTGTLRTLTRHRETAFRLTRLALTAPRFDAEAVDRMRAANISRIRSSLADPEWIASRLMLDHGYREHPYAQNSGGTLSTLPAITPDDLRRFAKTRLTKNRLLVSAVGDITPEELSRVLDNIFGKLPALADAGEIPMRAKVAGGGEIVHYDMNIPQTIIEIMQDGIRRDDPDFYAAQVMDFILGSSGFGSRLTEEIREKRGLTYGVQTGLDTLDYIPTYSLSTSTKNESAGEVLKLVKQEWAKMRDADVTEKELADAKSYLIGSVPLSLASTGHIASLMLDLQLENLPTDYLERRKESLEKLTAADVRRAAKRILDPDKLSIAVVGRPQGLPDMKTVEKLPNVD